MVTPTYKDLLHYGRIMSDKEHITTEGINIRFTTWEYGPGRYVTVKCDGEVVVIGMIASDI